MRRRILGFAALPLVVWGLAVAASHAATSAARSEAAASGFADGAHERLLADLERIDRLGLFERRGRGRDAAPALNRLVAADAPVEGTTPAWWARPDAFAAFEPVKTEWWAHPEVTEAYDLAFLAEWRTFDHWEWASADPFASHTAAHPEECAPEMPLVNFAPFATLAKIRMAQGLHRDELDEAAADVEALALLAYSTDSLVGALFGVALLGIEEKGLALGREAGKRVSHAHGWTAEDRTSAKAAFTALPAVFLDAPDSELARTLVARADELPGVCAGLAEAVWSRSLLRERVQERWPGEPDQRVFATALDDALARSGCGIASPRAAWARSQADCLAVGVSESDPWLRALDVPYLRAPILAELLGLAGPGFVGPYGRNAP